MNYGLFRMQLTLFSMRVTVADDVLSG